MKAVYTNRWGFVLLYFVCVTLRSLDVGGCWHWFRCLPRNLLGIFLPSSLAPECVGFVDLMTIGLPHGHKAAVTLQAEHARPRQEIKGGGITSKAPPSVGKQHILLALTSHWPELSCGRL